jgi:hypothetical protein
LIWAKPIFIAAKAAYVHRQNRQVFRDSGPENVRCAGFIVPAIQGVIRAFDENLTPLDQGSGEKAEHGADNDFLHKSGVHA